MSADNTHYKTGQEGHGKGKAYNSYQTHSSQDDEDVLIDVRSIFLMLWRRKYVIFGIMLIGFSLTIMALTIITPQYTARSLVLVESNQRSNIPSELKLLIDNYVRYDSTLVMNEIELIRSRSMARKVIERLELLTDPEFNMAYRESLKEYAPELLDRKQTYKSFNVFKSELGSLPPEIVEHQINTVVTRFLQSLSVRSIPGSYAIQIQFVSPDPAKAALIANTTADLYIEQRLEEKFKASRKLTDWLDERLEELRDQVRESELAVAKYRAGNNLTEGIRTYISTEQVSQLNAQLINAKASLAEAQARLSQIRALSKNKGAIETSGDVLSSGFIQTLRSDEAALMQEYAELSNRYGARHPAIVKIKNELAGVRAQINQEMQKVAASIANEVEVAQARVKALQDGLNDLKDVRDMQNEKLVRLNELEREADSNRMIFDNFLQTYKRSDEQEELQEAQARVISYAAVPAKPSYPDRLLFLSLGLALSLFLGMLLSFLLEKLDNKFRSARQLEKFSGFPCFALIPAVKSKTQQELANFILDKPSSTVAEAVRTLRTVINLRARRNGAKPKVITITSSFPGEGKTTISGWLSRLAAKSGEKVILIDGDLRRPNVHRSFGRTNDVTLVEYLTGKNKLEEVIVKDELSGLHIIYAKSVPNSALDLVSSVKMETLIEALRKEYDLVVIDSPACMAVSDARILATYSDEIIYTVGWDKTPREVVMSGVKQFSDMGYNNLAFTLTNVDVKRHVRYGYGDTVYYYGDYQEETA